MCTNFVEFKVKNYFKLMIGFLCVMGVCYYYILVMIFCGKKVQFGFLFFDIVCVFIVYEFKGGRK